MSGKESQLPNPETTDYNDFFQMVDSYAQERAKSARTVDMPECGYGSHNSPYRIFFNQDPWGYKLSVIGNSTKIPLDILGIRDEDITELGEEAVFKIMTRGVHRIDILITEKRLVVQGRLMNKADEDEKWDPEVSRLSPDTRSILPLIKYTSHRYRR